MIFTMFVLRGSLEQFEIMLRRIDFDDNHDVSESVPVIRSRVGVIVKQNSTNLCK
jgi:hypothetical protein